MKLLKTIRNQEQGQILVSLMFIIFSFACFGIVPLLDFMNTGVVTTRNRGLSTQELYSAEAGVWDAIWKIQRFFPGVPKELSDPPFQYYVSDNVNEKSVNVTISRISLETYRVNSVAMNPSTGHQRSIESDMGILFGGGIDLTEFTTYALSCPGTITAKPSVIIDGDIWIEDSDNYTGPPPNGSIDEGPIVGWPAGSQMAAYFSLLVDKSNPYSNDIIDISQPTQSGPLYADGEPNGNYTLTGTGNLTGVIYVNGNLYFNQNADVGLDGETVFVTGDVTTSPQSSVHGPGAIIALGNVNFSPQVSPEYLFVMSVSGEVNFQPNGDFVGSVSANTNINMQPNTNCTWQDPGYGNLNMPGLYNHISQLDTWIIS